MMSSFVWLDGFHEAESLHDVHLSLFVRVKTSELAILLCLAFSFSVSNFRTSSGMSNEQLIRITVCAKRNPKLSEDEFNDHWANKHGPLITSWLQRHNCVKYVQVRTSPDPISRSILVAFATMQCLASSSTTLHQPISRV